MAPASNRASCIDFLQWALPRMELRWAGFRNVRGQVCKRLKRRCAELELDGLESYRRYLEAHPAEWHLLAELCRITITRFGRDRDVWRRLTQVELPRLAELAAGQGRGSLAAWSAGCAGGEEPYTLCIGWRLEVAPHWPKLRLEVLGTDIDEEELGRARAASYPDGSLTELAATWRAAAFERRGPASCVRDLFRADVHFLRHDVREPPPPGGPFDVVLCRNLVFTYFDEALQRTVATALRSALRPGGVLVLGLREVVPPGVGELTASGPSFYLAS